MTSDQDTEETPDPRTLEAGICGDSFTNPSGMEWVCIRKTHSNNSHRYIYRFANPKGTK